VARPRQFDEEQVLEGAMGLFQRHGFEGVSVPMLSEELGICRQSLYSIFGDKRGLYLRALQRWGERQVDAKVAVLRGDGSPLARVHEVLDGFAAYAKDCPSEGCLTVTGLVEGRQDEECMRVAAAQVARLEKAFADALRRARACGELPGSFRHREVAAALVTMAQGIGLLARVPGSRGRIRGAVAAMRALVDPIHG
jgi:TetR/AcrR family transcriptional repressor of nem operon